jgi:hypothetical protein
MTPAVLDSFADDVDESYDPDLDHVEDQQDPHEMRVGIVSRALYSVASAAAKKPPTATIVVPFPVGVGEGDVSDRVYAVKRAYARSVSGWRLRALMAKPETVRRTWGKQFSDEFGQRNYTSARHTLLAPYYDAYALSLLRSQPEMSQREKQIVIQLGWHNALYNRRMRVPYSQYRPSQLREARLITRADCSGSVAGGCDWARILPQVDWRYTNTWVQINFGRLIGGISQAKTGDVIFYGSPSHEALYLGNGLVWSFGSYPIKILRHDYRHDRHSIRRFLPL